MSNTSDVSSSESYRLEGYRWLKTEAYGDTGLLEMMLEKEKLMDGHMKAGGPTQAAIGQAVMQIGNQITGRQNAAWLSAYLEQG